MSTGYRNHFCENSNCTHTKKIPLSCSGRYCPTCGKKLTDIWIEKQKKILPQCDWQHITFTMPSVLWPYFKDRPDLLAKAIRLASETLLKTAKEKGIKIGIFAALHTFGRDLKWNVHVHASVTMGGITENEQWKAIRFAQKVIMPMWRYRIINLLRKEAKAGKLEIHNQTLNYEYNKPWKVHFSNPTENANQTTAYVGRYVKRPPLSMSRLEHYDGKTVTFNFLNHKNKAHEKITFDADDFMERFTQHIPEKGFRLIRYYGFLANRVRSNLLPIIYELLGQEIKSIKQISWDILLKKSFGSDPLECILCGSRMLPGNLTPGKSKREMMSFHKALATRQRIPD